MEWMHELWKLFKRHVHGEHHEFEIPQLDTSFTKKLLEDEKREFVENCSRISNWQDVPLYTFRCNHCETVKPIPEMSGQTMYDEDGDLAIGYGCTDCE